MNGKSDFLLDINVILGFLKGDEKIAVFFSKNLTDRLFYVSQISRMELCKSSRPPGT